MYLSDEIFLRLCAEDAEAETSAVHETPGTNDASHEKNIASTHELSDQGDIVQQVLATVLGQAQASLQLEGPKLSRYETEISSLKERLNNTVPLEKYNNICNELWNLQIAIMNIVPPERRKTLPTVLDDKTDNFQERLEATTEHLEILKGDNLANRSFSLKRLERSQPPEDTLENARRLPGNRERMVANTDEPVAAVADNTDSAAQLSGTLEQGSDVGPNDCQCKLLEDHVLQGLQAALDTLAAAERVVACESSLELNNEREARLAAATATTKILLKEVSGISFYMQEAMTFAELEETAVAATVAAAAEFVSGGSKVAAAAREQATRLVVAKAAAKQIHSEIEALATSVLNAIILSGLEEAASSADTIAVKAEMAAIREESLRLGGVMGARLGVAAITTRKLIVETDAMAEEIRNARQLAQLDIAAAKADAATVTAETDILRSSAEGLKSAWRVRNSAQVEMCGESLADNDDSNCAIVFPAVLNLEPRLKIRDECENEADGEVAARVQAGRCERMENSARQKEHGSQSEDSQRGTPEGNVGKMSGSRKSEDQLLRLMSEVLEMGKFLQC